jgi:uncharacterized protein (TIGR01319 family)
VGRLKGISAEKARFILATDCGSTTSKVRFFKKINDEYRYIASGEAPTTVEAPYEDVTYGVRNAIKEVEQLTGHRILKGERIIIPSLGENEGVDLYISTSSAGGGLQMIVTGLIGNITAESARKAALGAGALVMDVLSLDDGKLPHERISRIRYTRPDMILFTGGVDGGEITRLEEMARQTNLGHPRPRQGIEFKVPIIFAGNTEAAPSVKEILEDGFLVYVVDNIRPTFELENLTPARDAIRQIFMEHVMAHAPGYDKLMRETSVPIMPTPAGEGTMFRMLANRYGENVIGVGLGGATTNLYSVYDHRFVLTISANLGMSYSIYNVLKEVSVGNIIRWLPFEIDEDELCDKLHNKAIHPTTIPSSLEDLMIEHAVAREAIRTGFQAHKYLARPLHGAVKWSAGWAWLVEAEESYIDMKKVDWICGTGGLLSHAPRRAQSALIFIDSFQPEGVTKLAQDSVFMMPHLGILSTVNQDAAMEVFERDCLVRLGTCVAFEGEEGKEGEEVATVKGSLPDGGTVEAVISYGTLTRIPLNPGESMDMEIHPGLKYDAGRGRGHKVSTVVEGGVVGVVIDARGRPLRLPEDDGERQRTLLRWFSTLDVYPNDRLERNAKENGG